MKGQRKAADDQAERERRIDVGKKGLTQEMLLL